MKIKQDRFVQHKHARAQNHPSINSHPHYPPPSQSRKVLHKRSRGALRFASNSFLELHKCYDLLGLAWALDTNHKCFGDTHARVWTNQANFTRKSFKFQKAQEHMCSRCELTNIICRVLKKKCAFIDERPTRSFGGCLELTWAK